MNSIEIDRSQLTVSELLRLLNRTDRNPGYQREGTLWSKERRQLFIDTIINGFDVPPIYLHRLNPPQLSNEGTFAYAVVDGLQRITAISEFDAGSFGLAKDFALLSEQPWVEDLAGKVGAPDEAEPLRPLADQRSDDLKRNYPSIYRRFLAYQIPVTFVSTDNEGLIEELFFRLNEGVPLTPAEKRHRGALLRSRLAPLLEGERAVMRIAAFKNRRRVHEDLLLRFLFIEAKMTDDSVPDMRKKLLDDFAAYFSVSLTGGSLEEREAALDSNVAKMMQRLEAMGEIFGAEDPLLNTSTWFFTFYLLIRHYQESAQPLPSRDELASFWANVAELEGKEEESMTGDQLDALELSGPMPASTTGSYYDRRLELYIRYLRGEMHL